MNDKDVLTPVDDAMLRSFNKAFDRIFSDDSRRCRECGAHGYAILCPSCQTAQNEAGR